MMMASFFRSCLPLELYREIHSFCDHKEGEFYSWMNTSKETFEDIKYQIFHYCFSLKKLLEQDIEVLPMLERLKVRVFNAERQIRYSLTGSGVDIQKIEFFLAKFPSLTLYDLTIEFVKYGQDSLLLSLNEQDKALTLMKWKKCMEIPWAKGFFIGNPLLETFEGIQLRLKELEVYSFAFLKNTAGLSHLEDICLLDCPALTNVTSLRNVKVVKLVECTRLSNLEGLGQVYNLSLMKCDRIEDISPLTHNCRLTIVDCNHIVKGFEDLNKRLHFLSTDLPFPPEALSRLLELKMFSAFGYRSQSFPVLRSLKSLTIVNLCPHLSLSFFNCLFFLKLDNLKSISVLGLGDIPVLYLSRIRELEDISDLGNRNKVVTILSCHKITDFSSLKNVRKVKIIGCAGFHNGFDVENVEDLTILACNDFCEVSMLGKLKRLCLSALYVNARQIPSLEALKDVLILELDFHSYIPLPPLGKNQKILCVASMYSQDPLLEKYYLKMIPLESRGDPRSIFIRILSLKT